MQTLSVLPSKRLDAVCVGTWVPRSVPGSPADSEESGVPRAAPCAERASPVQRLKERMNMNPLASEKCKGPGVACHSIKRHVGLRCKQKQRNSGGKQQGSGSAEAGGSPTGDILWGGAGPVAGRPAQLRQARAQCSLRGPHHMPGPLGHP